MNTARQLWRVVPRWTVGIAISTPVVAVLQGAFLLSDYRYKHGHAPRPNVPSQGVVVLSPDQDDTATSTSTNDRSRKNNNNFSWLLRRPRNERPLRLLVIGDSLAAGVGMSESSTPALPESIASALSKAQGGRPVIWKCVGTPGLSACQIVQEIHHLEDIPSPLPDRLATWQAESRLRAQERLEIARQRTQEWMEHRKEPIPVEELNPFVRWCKRRLAEIRRDVTELGHVIRQDETESERDQLKDSLPPKQTPTIVRRLTLDPEVVGQFDIAVVLTGLNDLKDSFLPFMMSTQRAKMLEENKARHGEGGLKDELVRILQALNNKMKKPTIQDENTIGDTSQSTDSQRGIEQGDHGPLVVFPALPFAPISVCRVAPLKWFVIPLIRMMDHNKKLLADLYPNLVLYVESPSLEVFSDAEAQRGPLWEDLRKDNVLLKLTDIAQNVRERIEKTMKQHYKQREVDAEEEDEGEGNYEIGVDAVSHSQHQGRRGSKSSNTGQSYVAADGVHPNDAGYELWGRLIAQNIVEEWQRRRAR